MNVKPTQTETIQDELAQLEDINADLLESADRVLQLLRTMKILYGESVERVMDFLLKAPSVCDLQRAVTKAAERRVR